MDIIILAKKDALYPCISVLFTTGELYSRTNGSWMAFFKKAIFTNKKHG
jgi:hypothetical protein